jgi:hypothetical protein
VPPIESHQRPFQPDHNRSGSFSLTLSRCVFCIFLSPKTVNSSKQRSISSLRHNKRPSIHAQAVGRSLKAKRRQPASRGGRWLSRCALSYHRCSPHPPVFRNAYSIQSPGIAMTDRFPEPTLDQRRTRVPIWCPGSYCAYCLLCRVRAAVSRGVRSRLHHVCTAVVVCRPASLDRAVVHDWSIEGITARIALHCTPRSLPDHAPAAGL